jgi:predicted dehydrogenase
MHARQVIAALRAGKHVFVEKPLCLSNAELDEIITAYEATLDSKTSFRPALMVGFNRRFAPFVLELKQHLRQIQEALMLHFRVNAGYIPASHWTQDPAEGGGRLLGEGCHFIDLITFLVGDAVRRVTTRALPDRGRYSRDNFSVALEFAGGSLGTVTYVANGDKSFGKESLEVFGGGLSARLDDYRNLSVRYAAKRITRTARLRQDKGHRAEWQAFVACLTGSGPVPIPFEEIVRSTKATLAAQLSLERGVPVMLDDDKVQPSRNQTN